MKHGEAKAIPRFVRRTSTTLPTLARTWSFPQLRSPKRSPPWPWPRWPWACPATGWRGTRRTWPSYGQRWKLCGCRRPHHRDMGNFPVGRCMELWLYHLVSMFNHIPFSMRNQGATNRVSQPRERKRAKDSSTKTIMG